MQGLSGEYESVQEAVYAYADALGISTVAEDDSMKSVEDLQKELASYGVIIADVTESVQESSDRMLDYSKALGDA